VSDEALRSLPKIDRVVAHPSLERARGALGVTVVTELARQAVAHARERVREGEPAQSLDAVAALVDALATARQQQRIRRVINATGVVLHTNLGRAPLSDEALEALSTTAGGYVALEVDRATGKRGGRGAATERALADLTGAEAALVVNNNAAAVLLALAAIACGRGVVVSRGELVEIGGGFRIPEVLARSGARMIEVGTTNKTRTADYARALDEEPDVAAILRVHPGNFKQTGFVERPPLESLSELARARGVTTIEDLGGGLLADLELPGLSGEPLVGASVAGGMDLVCFSTDKALGGPQGGAVVGRAALVERLRSDPLARAVRMGRLPLVALEATVLQLLRGDRDGVPVLAALRRPVAEIRARAESWAATLRSRGVACQVVDLEAMAGGGAFAQESLASVGLALEGSAEGQLAALRRGEAPVFARIVDDRVVLDARTVLPGEDDDLLHAIVALSTAK
jgi:L-seryl-tRNA(Ser) seleniumtransferase